jgi:hypothetical protein
MAGSDCLRLLTIAWMFSSYNIAGAYAQEPAQEKALTALQARDKVGSEVLVELTVKAAKNRLEKRGEILLDSEEDFRDENNLAIVVTREGATSFRSRQIEDPAVHFVGKMIRVRGTVILKDDRLRIEINDAAHIVLVPAK